MEPDAYGLHTCTATAPPGASARFRPEWRTETVVGLLRGIVEDGAFERMPILADALEEAGCTDERVLCHCREPIAHGTGCWVLGVILTPPAAVSEKTWADLHADFSSEPQTASYYSQPQPAPDDDLRVYEWATFLLYCLFAVMFVWLLLR